MRLRERVKKEGKEGMGVRKMYNTIKKIKKEVIFNVELEASKTICQKSTRDKHFSSQKQINRAISPVHSINNFKNDYFSNI